MRCGGRHKLASGSPLPPCFPLLSIYGGGGDGGGDDGGGCLRHRRTQRRHCAVEVKEK